MITHEIKALLKCLEKYQMTLHFTRVFVWLARQEEEACTVSLRANQRRKEYTVGALTRENRQHADRISELECRLK